MATEEVEAAEEVVIPLDGVCGAAEFDFWLEVNGVVGEVGGRGLSWPVTSAMTRAETPMAASPAAIVATCSLFIALPQNDPDSPFDAFDDSVGSRP